MTHLPFRLRLAQKTQHRIYYGWVVVGVMVISNLMAFSINPTFGLFITPLEAELGWSRSAISLAPTLGTLFGICIVPMLGFIADRFGVRRLLLSASVIVAICLSLLSQITSLWQFYLLFGLLSGVLSNGIGLLGSSVVISRWFAQRRGRAMATVMMGASGGAFLFISLLSYLIEKHSWRTAYLVHGSLALVFIAIPVGLLLIDRPEQLKPKEPPLDNTIEGEKSTNSKTTTPEDVSWTLTEAIRTRALWLTLAGSMLGAFSVGGYFTHAVPHMENLGFSRTLASSAWATFFFVGVFAKGLWGFVTDWIGVRWALSFLYLGETLGLFLLLSASKPAHLFFYAVITAICHGPFLQLSSQVWGDLFGPKNVGRIYGSIQPGIVIASAAGPLAGGVLFDLTGNYQLFFKIMMGLTLTAAAIFWLTPPPVKPIISDKRK